MTPIDPAFLRDNPLPVHAEGSKEARGDVLAIGGSLEVPGAILLAAEAALRAGAGRLAVATCRSLAPHLGLAVPEAMVLGLDETYAGGMAPSLSARLTQSVARAGAILIGPGMMEQPASAELARAVLRAETAAAIMIDAGALASLADAHADPALAARHGRLVITPHAGEMAKLLDITREAVESDPLAAAREAARRIQGVVVMKGASTWIVSPQGEAWHFDGGCIGLATSGSGDVLAGILAGLLARGAAPARAAAWAVFLHGTAGCILAARVGPLGFLARELSAEVPALMAAHGAE